MRFSVVPTFACLLGIVSSSITSFAQPSSPELTSTPLAARDAAAESETLFTLLSADESGVVHRQTLDWYGPSGNLYYTGFACGGIAVGDVDGNGLPDLLLLGAAQPNRLFLQMAPLKFEDRTEAAGLVGDADGPLGGDGWSAGAAIFDIDNDGDLDIYICNYDSANRLYVNRGDGTFDEQARQYGLDVIDASLTPSICDYDRDGDVDIYLAVNRYMDEKNYQADDLFYQIEGQEYLRPEAEKLFSILRHPNQAKQINMWIGGRDRLLRNEGPNRPFTDVTNQSMQVGRADTLSATWWDYDHDGWPDLYVCNDLAAPDALYHNNGDGTFANVAEKCLPHTPWSAMGSSAGDVNGDGLVDFLAADMAFRTHFKDKVFMGNMSTKFDNIRYFPGDQLMRNALYINTGTPHFQEAAYACGLASTDWTWTAKLADLDGDGRLDAFFTNGTPVSLSVPEALLLSNTRGFDTGHTRRMHADLPPVVEQNVAFRNAGHLRFDDQSAPWGLDHVGMSYAAAHVDLDSDGDLDLVVANLDDNVSIYRNNSSTNHAATIRLRGSQSNWHGIGAEVTVVTSAGRQIQQCYPTAGFLSCQDATLYFGLGDAQRIETLTVEWPSGARQQFEDLEVDQFYEIAEPAAPQKPTARRREIATPLLKALNDFAYVEHHEEPYDDFERQPLLPNKLSQFGPPLATGDIDNDGDLDLFVGEGSGWMGMVQVNDGSGRFVPSPQVALADDAAAEDIAAVMADFDRDGDVDLYVGSGGVECEPGDAILADRLYLNDGRGRFQRARSSWLPKKHLSTSAIAAHDFDDDGDVDLFVGSRSIPGEYPVSPEHRLLKNDGDRFIDVLDEVGPDLARAGMVTAAVWSDVNGDDRRDLLVATDWGPIRCYVHEGGRLVERTAEAGLAQRQGWWCSIAAADLDGDGDNDFVAGNFGLNTKYKASPESPVMIYYGDYGDGKPHLIEASYEDDVLFPMRGKSCSSRAMPFLAEKFPTYEQFAKATLVEVYTPKCLEEATRFEVNELSSGCFMNQGNGKFEFKPLPIEVQLAPVFAIALDDVDGDGTMDLVAGQNFFSPQSETGEMDGGVGVLALGNGDGTFRPLRPDRAGLVLATDVKSLLAADIDGDGDREWIVGNNNDRVAAFGLSAPPRARGGSRFQTSLQSAQGPSLPTPTADQWVTLNLQLAREFVEGGKPAAALSAVRRALKVAPRSPPAQLLMAAVFREAGRFADAQRMIDQVSEEVFSDNSQLRAAIHLAQGRLLHGMRRYDEAIPVLRKAVAADPQNGKAQLHFGETLLAQGRLDEAQMRLTAASNLGDPRADVLLQHVIQRRQAARKLYREALRRQVEGDDQGAAKFYRQSLVADSRHQLTLNNMAWLLASTKVDEFRDPWFAVLLAEQANQVAEQEVPDILDTLAYAYAANGQFEKAAKTMYRILDLPDVKKDQEKQTEIARKLRAYLAGEMP